MYKSRVSIITMHKVINFGSALQAWALQEMIATLGYDSSIIDYEYPNSYYYQHVPKVTNTAPKKTFFNLLKKIRLTKLKKYIIDHYVYSQQKQSIKFNEFWKNNFHLSRKYISPEDLKNDPPVANILVTGSDQVWNPNTMYGDPSFFLDFGNSLTPRVSYAASFGKNSIPESYKSIYQQYLLKYNFLSVRESTGATIIKKLINKESNIVCDPTLLLTNKDYDILESQSSIDIKKPYLLAYILDYAFDPNPVIEKLIEKVSKSLGLHVVYLLCGKAQGYKLGTTTIADAGPNEFLHLFKNANFVITSSFHGTAFSLIYNKNFYSVVPTQKHDGRISSLLSLLKLENRAIPADQNLSDFELQFAIDYSAANIECEKLRNSSIDFLRHSLKDLQHIS